MHDCAVCRSMSLACCQKAYTLRCCHAHSFAVLLRQHAGCPGKRDPTFAQSLAEVLVAVHQRHLMLTAACSYTHARSAIACAHMAHPAIHVGDLSQIQLLSESHLSQQGIPSIIRLRPLPVSLSAKHRPQSSSGPDPRTTTPLLHSALRQLLA